MIAKMCTSTLHLCQPLLDENSLEEEYAERTFVYKAGKKTKVNVCFMNVLFIYSMQLVNSPNFTFLCLYHINHCKNIFNVSISSYNCLSFFAVLIGEKNYNNNF